ncbi:3'-5' exonuclease [Streptomyces antimycoticus]|uniref:3'-5' exonuclease n=1 Tax=Streptomyces antimycoticus TaxID=68175 RepID=UPI001F1D9628|nr:3'-5' exonuclease [Streptomyces antimycoticus]
MSTTTATEQIPPSRTETDPAPRPREHLGSLPVYGWGRAPAHLRTQTQMASERLKLAAEQKPVAYLYIQRHGTFELYDPADAEKMRPLPSSTKAKMAARRTCPECGKVRQAILNGRTCSVCRERKARERERLLARTCVGCKTVRERPYPDHRRCQSCRKEQLVKKRERVEAWIAEVTVCAADDCSARIGSKKAARAFLKSKEWLLSPERADLPSSMWWPDWPRRCPPCKEAYEAEQERQRAEYQARYEQQEKERQERERREAEERQRWAAAALADSDVLVLDTETTGLHAEARIVELAVLNSCGEVLLDTLLDPGEPVPGDAARIHKITSEMVAGAPTFSSIAVRLTELLDHKRVLIYNKWFDVERLRWELTLHYLDRAARELAAEAVGTNTVLESARERALVEAREQANAWIDAMTFEDVMIPYSDWVGDWSDYHGNNRWQPLDGGHRAAGDCRAVLDCLRAMGRAYADEYAAAAIGTGAMSEGTG